ncbi:MAG: DUF4405 domain-containing protein [Gammaproteobacteria bacterium]|nr:MAG: DUF4405 domain-containing protein [Gammaproteobacteria bacterium]
MGVELHLGKKYLISPGIDMKRTRLNFLIDTIAFIGFAFLTTTGVLMRYILPPGSGHHSTIWDLDRHDWGAIHFWIALIFFLILALHLVLHWRWIINVAKGHPREASGYRVGLGVIGLAAVVALSISPLVTPVQRDSGSKPASSPSHQYEDIPIRGSMTFTEVEETTGVPAQYIIQLLRMPESISADERLGPLKSTYGFEIDDVRKIVKEYKKTK